MSDKHEEKLDFSHIVKKEIEVGEGDQKHKEWLYGCKYCGSVAIQISVPMLGFIWAYEQELLKKEGEKK